MHEKSAHLICKTFFFKDRMNFVNELIQIAALVFIYGAIS